MNKNVKIKPLIISAIISLSLTAFITIAVTLILANIGELTHNLIGNEQVTAALNQLKHADIRVELLLQLALFILSFNIIMFFRFYRNKKLTAIIITTLSVLVFFVIELMLTRVNGVPVYTAVNVIMSIMNSGVL